MTGIMLWDPDDPRRIEWERKHPRLMKFLGRIEPLPVAMGLSAVIVAIVLSIVLKQLP